MPWDESDSGKRKNGWGNGPGAEQGPPDLAALLARLFGIFTGGSGRGSHARKPGSFNFTLIATIAVVVWLLSSIYIISEGKRGVVLRFGEYREITMPGPHWHIPYPIETVETVDVGKVRSAQSKVSMLTQDENIVEVELAVQYRVKDAADYLFNVRIPDVADDNVDQSRGTLFQVMVSALREAIGKNKMDFILGEGRAEVAAQTQVLMQSILDDYRSGLDVLNVNLQQSQPPAAVQGAFADAIKAREDEIRFINEAEAYANGIIPQARGEAARMEAEANAYRQKVIENSKGEAARFIKLHEEYRKAPRVTRDRLYIQALQSVLSNSNKVMVDVKDGNNVFYLPLNKMLEDGMEVRSSRTMAPPSRSDSDSASSNGSLENKARSAVRRMLNTERNR